MLLFSWCQDGEKKAISKLVKPGLVAILCHWLAVMFCWSRWRCPWPLTSSVLSSKQQRFEAWAGFQGSKCFYLQLTVEQWRNCSQCCHLHWATTGIAFVEKRHMRRSFPFHPVSNCPHPRYLSSRKGSKERHMERRDKVRGIYKNEDTILCTCCKCLKMKRHASPWSAVLFELTALKMF